jgi:hypothetical protein
MFQNKYVHRAKELQLAPASRVGSRTAAWKWRLPLLVLCSVGIFLWSREAFVPSPPAVLLSSSPRASQTDDEWSTVVAEIDRLRNNAVELRDVGALALAVHPEAPAFGAEAALIEQLIARDLRVTGMKYVVRSVQERFRRWSGDKEFVEIEVVDERSQFTETDADGHSFTVPLRTDESWNLTLMRAKPDQPWKLWNVEPVTRS